MLYQYPGNVFDRPRNMLNVLGSFWSRTYVSSSQVLTYTRALTEAAAQAHLGLLELVASLSRYTVPIWHRENWYLLTLRESDRNSAAVSHYRFDEGLVFDSSVGARFDTARAQPYHEFPLPEKLRGAAAIMNRLTDPSLVLTQGLDYWLDEDRGALVFRENPFESDLVATRPVYEGGEIVDQEAALWIFQGDFDYEHAYRQFGYVLGIQLQSSRGYRDLINAIFDALVVGGAQHPVLQAFQAVTGVPLVQEATETVEVVSRDNASQLIITDQHVYRFHLLATPLVTVGEEVHAGQALVDTLEILDFSRGETPASLGALALGRGMLAACFYGDLIFENRSVPLEVDTEHESGYTYLSFGLGGFPADVTRFFDELHTKGVLDAERTIDPCDDTRRHGTLAHLLDTRTNRTGEPTAANLPTTINPLEFLIANVLRNNFFAVRVKVSGLGPQALGLYNIRHLQPLIPPGTGMLVICELSPHRETISGEDLLQEQLETHQGTELLSDTVSESYVSEGRLRVRLFSGSCQ